MTAAAELIGRTAEVAELTEALDHAQQGHGRLVLIAGEAGIGKTALIEALADTALERGVPTYWGRCWEGGGGAVFWPWTQVLRAALADAPDAMRPELGPLVPELAVPAGGHPGSRFGVFDAVTSVMESVAGRHGALTVVLDDLHAADVASLQLLRYVARRASEARVLLIGTYRPGDLAASPERRVPLEAAARTGLTVELGGLGQAGVQDLLARAGVADRTLARPLRALTDGNPFLVLESSRLLAAGADPSRLAQTSGSVRHRRATAGDTDGGRSPGAAPGRAAGS